MGKGNRVRMAKANEIAQSQSVFTAKKQKKSAPAWVSTVVIVVVLALLISVVAVSVIAEGGFALRSVKAAQSDNFTITGPMMSYYFYQTYNTFLSQYGSIISYMGLDTSLSLKTQTAMGSEDGQTWFDYFMDPTIEQVENMLVYCEEAKARGIELDDKDYADIDEAIAGVDPTSTNDEELKEKIRAFLENERGQAMILGYRVACNAIMQLISPWHQKNCSHREHERVFKRVEEFCNKALQQSEETVQN